MDSIFSPVRRVAYDVEAARVGQRTDYDKLSLDITTDGSVDPKDALGAGRRDPHPPARDLHRSRADRGLRRGCAGSTAASTARVRARARDGELPDRGARARRPLVQLPQARRHRDDRRPRDEDGARARLDPELRQEVDRGGQGDARPARPPPARREGSGGSGAADAARSAQERSSAATRRTARRCTRTSRAR